MKKQELNPVIKNLQNKEDKNITRALRTKALELALATEKEDIVKAAARIYKFIEYGTIEHTKDA